MTKVTIDNAETPSDYVNLIGEYMRDWNTGIVGRVTAVCFCAHESTQFRLTRHGVQTDGTPYEPYWTHALDCAPSSREEAEK